MVARLTPAEAKALGIDVAGRTPRQRRVARGRYHTRCCTAGCDATFDTEAAEERHAAADPTHARYELVLGAAPKGTP